MASSDAKPVSSATGIKDDKITKPSTSLSADSAPKSGLQDHRPMLSVRDALKYLDTVKGYFNHTRPEVYNMFLDIMRDFKSANIDTPGVIDRVSNLFKGYPTLIQGFNAFLPPSYRIECMPADKQNPDGYIIITTPSGTTRIESNQASNFTGINKAATTETAKPAPFSSAVTPASTSAVASTPALQAPAVTSAPVSSVQTFGYNQPGSAPSSQQTKKEAPRPAAPSASGRAVPEFSYAVDYVNRIKKRFNDGGRTYTQFLSALQKYQQEKKSIQEVYAEVTALFKEAPDLLEDFKSFLPDESPKQAHKSSNMGMLGEAANDNDGKPGVAKPKVTNASTHQEEPPTKKKKISSSIAQPLLNQAGSSTTMEAVVGSTRNKGGPRKKPVALPTAQVQPSSITKAPIYPPEVPMDPNLYPQGRFDPSARAQPDAPWGAYSYPTGSQPDQFASATSAQQASQQAPKTQPPPPLPHRTSATAEEVAFFDKTSAYINDKNLYHEFLKVLNLYTQDIIELHVLVARVRLFLREAPELWAEFREMVGWNDGMPYQGGRVENGEWMIDHIPVDMFKGVKPDLEDALTSGPCYRKLPQTEQKASCSGRDALCWEVLNDEWVSNPTWASEDGFVSSRKNDFEAALHRTEEERYEYDWHIEASARMITILETLASRIAVMDPAERETFKLKPGMGAGISRSFYQIIIKKVYGAEAGLHVLNALHENPCVAIPIVLARLKQKDEEWKRALREWNRVWREADAKNYLKALDHQGILIKNSDKKAVLTKSLVSELEVIKREQSQKRIANTLGIFVPDTPRHQLAYSIANQQIIFDVLKLALAFLDRSTGIFPVRDKDRIEQFLRHFIPSIFCIAQAVVDEHLAPLEEPKEAVVEDAPSEAGDATSDAGGNASATEDEVTPVALNAKTKKRGRKETGDLRRRALKKATGPGRRGNSRQVGSPAIDASTSAVSSREATPDVEMSDDATADLSGIAAPDIAFTEDNNMVIDTQEAPYEKPVPATAGGLDGMEGVQTVSTSGALQNTAPLDQASEPAKSPSESVDMPLANLSGVVGHIRNDTPLISHATLASRVPASSRQRFNFFCGTSHYCLLRIFQMIYSRLDKMQQAAGELTEEKNAYDTTGTAAHQLYEEVLARCEDLFDGKLEGPQFEDSIRRLYGVKGYWIYTIDRLLIAMLRLVQVVSDPTHINVDRNERINELLRNDRIRPDVTTQQQVAYRSNIESALGQEENLYRVEWVPLNQRLNIQLLGKDEMLPEDEREASVRWKRYMLSYAAHDKTEGVKEELMRKVNLKRSLPTKIPSETEQKANVTAGSGLEVRICLRTYRIFFNTKGTDWLARRIKPKRFDERKAKEKFQAWLAAKLAVSSPEASSSVPITEKEPSPPADRTQVEEAVKPLEPLETAKEGEGSDLADMSVDTAAL